MKKALLVVMVLVFAMSLSFAAAGKVSFLVDKGVVTAGDAVNVTFTLEETEVEEGLTTISVLGEQLTPNVWVMLVQGGNAQYEATKAVDEEGKKTVYYIRAMELKGQMVTLYAKLTDWNGKVIKEESKSVEWDESAFSDVVALVPAAEGIYSIDASITLEDGTVIAMGAGQLIAMKKFIEQKVDGLVPVLGYASPRDGRTGVEKNEYILKIKTGVEFMTQFDESKQATNSHLSIYGDGSEFIPHLYWKWNPRNKPVMGDVELVYQPTRWYYGTGYTGSGNHNGGYYSSGGSTQYVKTAYIQFKILSEALEGDCCGASAGDKWALWLAIGTGEYHTMYEASYYLNNCSTTFHYIGVDHYKDWYWQIIKGDLCKGWIKAIFYLDPADVKIWVYAIVGTQFHEEYVLGEEEDSYYNQTSVLSDYNTYSANLLENAELNLFGKIIFKDIVTIQAMAINIPLVGQSTQPVVGGSIDIDLNKISMGAAYRVDLDVTDPWINAIWAAHFVVNETFSLPIKGGFPFEAFNNIGFGVFAAGSFDGGLTDEGSPAFGFTPTHIQLILELGGDITCCLPEIHFGLHVQKITDLQNGINKMMLTEIWGKYSHDLGTYGPVNLTGTLGIVYAPNKYGTIDQAVGQGWYGNNGYYGVHDDALRYDWGGYGEEIYTGPAIGVAYEVTGQMKW